MSQRFANKILDSKGRFLWQNGLPQDLPQISLRFPIDF